MRAVVFHEAGRWSIEHVADPAPQPDEVVIAVRACGLCGTDLHLLQGEFRPDYPLIPGHEYSGRVVEVGAAVREFRPGDAVAIDPNYYCGGCRYCQIAYPQFCENWFGYGVKRPGGFAEYSAVVEKNVLRLPDGVPFEHGAMVEPVACCLHGVDLAGVRAGDHVVIIGAGGIGQILAQLVRAAGASTVTVSDPLPQKRELALALGATHAIDPEHESLVDSVMGMTGVGADVVIEAAGTRASVTEALRVARKGGTVMWFSVCDADLSVAVEPYDLFMRELTVRTSFTNPFTSARALRLIAAGRVDLTPIISHTFALADFGACMDSMRAGVSIKAQVRFD
ncbi:MAG TPA: zinc-dependent alcohol dehydrogenase family protein [Armatimonadota bacterium]|nr:zinc-dependent alcohol dehydrogenase family protein [Armatimonadota bacterium]